MNHMLSVLENERPETENLKTKQSLPKQHFASYRNCIAVKKKKKKSVQEPEHEDQYQISFSNVPAGLA